MSADNWVVCPKCQKRACKRLRNHEKSITEKLEAVYGKVSQDAYMELREKLHTKEKELQVICENPEQTLREDYPDIGVDIAGTIRIKYKCSCDKCGFQYEFEHKEDINLDKK